ncbi:hypothetical protein DWF00_09755 [Bosea caraganae]|uniref:Uncharacterized protein n=1 Tax=Bosea caraganae TaxID=2763117 RepID=A0A370LCM3_9HYPH|nr:hypothetical protein [Bosea caraganae]RDJ27259.1 hypothetical protein DWF00_09755 [Bosea caraganae]RDJ29275.1 hypothetical protein DWE98_01525 [Bosea caraganae]
MFRPEAVTKTNAVYIGLLIVQTAAATFLFWVVFPLFRQLIARLGEPQEVSVSVEVQIIVGTLVLHCAYWVRYRWIAVTAPFHSAFIGHVVQFASRTSFFFGGALFSALFFRHLPELEAFPTIAEALTRGLVVIWVLFALFCYSLELDRLGKAIEEASKPSAE